jgi:hypothetical protein
MFSFEFRFKLFKKIVFYKSSFGPFLIYGSLISLGESDNDVRLLLNAKWFYSDKSLNIIFYGFFKYFIF